MVSLYPGHDVSLMDKTYPKSRSEQLDIHTFFARRQSPSIPIGIQPRSDTSSGSPGTHYHPKVWRSLHVAPIDTDVGQSGETRPSITTDHHVLTGDWYMEAHNRALDTGF